MQVVNLLNFLNSVHDLYALSFAECDREMCNILENVKYDEQFTQSIDFGVIYVKQIADAKYLIVDGLNRICSILLLLHAVCECYKKTTERNENAIKTIRSKYLINNSEKPKLHLGEEDSLFEKIINAERLSGHEKNKPMFKLLHKYWSTIKEQKLKAAQIFKLLQKINVMLTDIDEVSPRDVYYKVNSQRNIDQLKLVENLFQEYSVISVWNKMKADYFLKNEDIFMFFRDYFITKFNYNTFDVDFLYEYMKNYFDTMLQYQSPKVIIENMKRSALLYNNILNINFENREIQQAFINIKRHNGEDTYAYILNVYEDFYTGNISESIFLEILKTIDEYLVNRLNSGNSINFNELIDYLNAFITCK